VAQGNSSEALKSYRDGLAIRDRLAHADPGNAGWQRDLSVLLTLKIPSIRADFGQAASFVNVLELAFRAVIRAVTTMRPCVVRR